MTVTVIVPTMLRRRFAHPFVSVHYFLPSRTTEQQLLLIEQRSGRSKQEWDKRTSACRSFPRPAACRPAPAAPPDEPQCVAFVSTRLAVVIGWPPSSPFALPLSRTLTDQLYRKRGLGGGQRQRSLVQDRGRRPGRRRPPRWTWPFSAASVSDSYSRCPHVVGLQSPDGARMRRTGGRHSLSPSIAVPCRQVY